MKADGDVENFFLKIWTKRSMLFLAKKRGLLDLWEFVFISSVSLSKLWNILRISLEKSTKDFCSKIWLGRIFLKLKKSKITSTKFRALFFTTLWNFWTDSFFPKLSRRIELKKKITKKSPEKEEYMCDSRFFSERWRDFS